ncbi:MAG: hypothetical protein DMG95_13065 [Acidobacteria bacterium]|nr:MAG: hypothetical protein DMG95_13065 [Acidobacteriota bacterium]
MLVRFGPASGFQSPGVVKQRAGFVGFSLRLLRFFFGIFPAIFALKGPLPGARRSYSLCYILPDVSSTAVEA